MKNNYNGKVIKHDNDYLLTIPNVIMKKLNLKDGDAVQFTIDGDTVILSNPESDFFLQTVEDIYNENENTFKALKDK